MIEVDNVTKNYGTVRAVRGVTFKVEKGEILGLLGPNAAGKTTLMRIMTGYLPATGGTVRVDGHDIYDQPFEVKRRIGYLPENPPLYHEMTVRGYITFAAEIKGVPRGDRRKRVSDVIEVLNLGNVANRLIGHVSKGYKQRVGLAQAMVHKPDVLVLDEPTVGLDPKQIIEIRNVIRDLGREHTIVLSSHILPEVSATCDRVVILNEGAVAAIDSQDQLSARLTGGERLIVELEGKGVEGAADAFVKVSGVTSVASSETRSGKARLKLDATGGEDTRRSVSRLAIDNGWLILEMSRDNLSLEEVFLKLTTNEVHE